MKTYESNSICYLQNVYEIGIFTPGLSPSNIKNQAVFSKQIFVKGWVQRYLLHQEHILR